MNTTCLHPHPTASASPSKGHPAQSIGVFDSGIGGLSILRALRELLPHENMVYMADTGHAPYGEKGDAFVIERTDRIARHLIEQGIKILVVACNTATAAAVHHLRRQWPNLPIVGVEPGLKPAAQRTATGRIAVMATRGTLQSAKFKQLVDTLPKTVQVHCQPCDGLAGAIERLELQAIPPLLDRYLQACGPFGPQSEHTDTLVLGCTHYPLVMNEIARRVGSDVVVLDTAQPVARQTQRLLELHQLLNPAQTPGHIQWLTSGPPSLLKQAVEHWLQWQAADCGVCQA